MKNECTYTRARLKRYHDGHLFKIQASRISRHLASCPVCSSAYDAERRIDETQRILRDVAMPEGMSPFRRAASSMVTAGRRLVYRPLWTALLLSVLAAGYLYGLDPLLHDPDLERLDASAPLPAEPAAPAEDKTSAPASPVVDQQPGRREPAGVAKTREPLIITITVETEHEQTSVRQINEAMKEHTILGAMQFSDGTKEISGSLTAQDLSTFFSRIKGVGKLSYRRSRLASADAGELLPFVLKLRAEPRRTAPAASPEPVEKPGDKAAERPVERTVEKNAGGQQQPEKAEQVERPVDTLVDKPTPTNHPAP